MENICLRIVLRQQFKTHLRHFLWSQGEIQKCILTVFNVKHGGLSASVRWTNPVKIHWNPYISHTCDYFSVLNIILCFILSLKEEIELTHVFVLPEMTVWRNGFSFQAKQNVVWNQLNINLQDNVPGLKFKGIKKDIIRPKNTKKKIIKKSSIL